MNKDKSPEFPRSTHPTRLHTAPEETHPYDFGPFLQIPHHSPLINSKKPLNIVDWISFPSSGNSGNSGKGGPEVQDDLLNEAYNTSNPQRDDHLFLLKEEDDDGLEDHPSYANKSREDKYLRRRQKNEKNYKDLNKSLANLALKRIVNRSSSTDANSWLSEQLQAQVEKSYNFEFQPPAHGGQASHSNTGKEGSTTSNCSITKTQLSTTTQDSPFCNDKKVGKSLYSPERNRPRFYQLEQQDRKYTRSQTPKKEQKPFVSNLNLTNIETGSDQKGVANQHKAYSTRWGDHHIKFFPEIAERTLSEKSEERKEAKFQTPRDYDECDTIFANRSFPNICSANIQTEPNYSFNNFNGIVNKSQVLDSQLPSKIDLNEQTPPKENEDSFFGIGTERTIPTADHFSQGVRSTHRRLGNRDLSKAKQSVEALSEEQKEIENWKTEIMKIKMDMKKRRKDYFEVNKFLQTQGLDHDTNSPLEHNSHEAQRPHSIFSSSNFSKYDGYDSKSSNLSSTNPMTPVNARRSKSKKKGQVSFDLTFEEQKHVKKPQALRNRPAFRNIKDVNYYSEQNLDHYSRPGNLSSRNLETNSQNVKLPEQQSCNIF